MILSVWKSTGFGLTDARLSESFLAKYKKELPDEWHALKYIVFPVAISRGIDEKNHTMNESLEMLDCAKQYNLTRAEFEEACRAFVSYEPARADNRISSLRPLTPKKTRKIRELLPEPKIGQVLWRKDSRRKGSCRIIKQDLLRTTVYWLETNRHTTILNSNLRNPFLFSHSRV
ncbi:MAG TPA: hypothetical protein DCP55_08120 [Chitinophagaceae bacterium]|nr:hypothetical protein [Pseudomonadota bacterium]HAL95873.1 hypothetical protein [Chitinophagaceae bacterium]